MDRNLDSLTYNRIREMLSSASCDDLTEALEILVRRQGERAVDLLGDIAGSGNSDLSSRAMSEICRRGAEALSMVLACLEKKTRGFRERIFASLAAMAPNSTPILLGLTESHDEAVYYWSLEVLCRIRPEGFEDKLAARLSSGSRERRLHAARAAGRIQAVTLTGELVRLLSDPFGSVRDEAYASLAVMGRIALDRTVSCLGNIDGQSRERCLELIGEISGKDSAAPLRSILETIDNRRLDSLVRIGSTMSLENSALGQICRQLASGSTELSALIQGVDHSTILSEAHTLLESPEAEERYWGAVISSIIGDRSSSSELLNSLAVEGSPTVKRALLTALSKTGIPDESAGILMDLSRTEEDPELLASILFLAATRAVLFPGGWYLEFTDSAETVVRRAALTGLELRAFPWE
ncbi:MAG: hypothetical protein CVV64_02325 [Candidatus Wallbacteria bacterium HGW-Wallbacteria-1]|jgi:HEAT repeat protein|uniref:HEAT repeat domain-containing protein n=1 Tax=Candidatus Wallbacteria bacterium HGW-Wallbacteria-1 TaxID=2013854 RepID=A0A2N1PVA5_9BACT|nr:MAG: hypothetical protein CVV64_02325 [Candidatus Wallbacteria bacterium HGW-Wallbacteria-1]